ncbi:MAG: Crp/Fnr family transcriptional regulator, partial [Chloroflexota bacterium]
HLVRHYPDGHEVVLATKIPDHVIGELSMLSGRLHTGSVVAVGDCDLIKLTREAVYDICEQFPCIAQQALTHMAARLHTLNLHARESALGDTQARVASVLLMVANPPAGRVAGEISVARLARATALDVDMVEHMLKSWEREGVVTFQRGQLTLHDVEVLQRIAG